MNQQANLKLIGAFVIGAVALIVVVFMYFGSGDFLAKKDYYVTYFKSDVNGLKIGAPVKVRGVNIGKVTSVTALMAEDASVLVEVKMETLPETIQPRGGLAEQLHEMDLQLATSEMITLGLRARLETESMVTGVKYVRLGYFPDTPVELLGLEPDIAEIPAIPTSGEELNEKLNSAIASVNEMPIVEITQSLHSTLTGLDSLIRSPQIGETIESLNRDLVAMEELIGNFDNRFGELIQALENNSETLNNTLQTTNSLLANLDDIADQDRFLLQSALK